MQTHHGHHKPFRCKLCSFKSSYNSRLKTHILKAHAGELASLMHESSELEILWSSLSEIQNLLPAHKKKLFLTWLRVHFYFNLMKKHKEKL